MATEMVSVAQLALIAIRSQRIEETEPDRVIHYFSGGNGATEISL